MAGHENSGDALERLRRRFLEGGAARGDYWQSETDLAAYDQTFGQRIAWKWDDVLADLARLGWSPPPGAHRTRGDDFRGREHAGGGLRGSPG